MERKCFFKNLLKELCLNLTKLHKIDACQCFLQGGNEPLNIPILP